MKTIYILIISSIVDYVTGIFKSCKNGITLKSKISVNGIYSKILMLVTVFVAYIMDYGISYITHSPMTYTLYTLTTVWLSINELLSICENLNNCGIDLPPFLTKILNDKKEKIENENNND